MLGVVQAFNTSTGEAEAELYIGEQSKIHIKKKIHIKMMSQTKTKRINKY